MIQLIFSLRYQSQLRRTRPRLLKDLEKSIIEVIEGYGGKVRIEQKLITAVFDRHTIGFWLDVLCVLEEFKKILEKTASELYGHVCVIGEQIPEEDILAQMPSSDLQGTGIWCSPEIKSALKSYIDFDEALTGENPITGFSQVRTIRKFGDAAETQSREKKNSEKIRTYLKQGSSSNTIIVGDERIGKGEGLYRYCEEQMKGFPPLLVRFKEKTTAVTCFVDAFSPEIKSLMEGEGTGDKLSGLKNRLEILGKILFQERLRDELSEFSLKGGEQFLSLLLESYQLAAEKRSIKPMMILENIQDADSSARIFIQKAHFARPARERLRIYGTATELKTLESWEELFPRIVKFTPEKLNPQKNMPALPRDLWEIGYCCVLLIRYFPSFLISHLLQEEGKNPAMVEKSMSILSRLEAIEGVDFTSRAEKALGKDAETVHALVRRRLLAWVGNFRLKPCFPLLTALADLGSRGDDNLILDSISADIVNGTFCSIEKALQKGTFAQITGKENEKALISIIKTQRALCHGGRVEIEEAFRDALSGISGSPGIRARAFANAASYYLGIGEIRAAEDSVKEAMLISQNENENRGLARIYRLFSLVQFANYRLSDAIDYFSFAIENAEKSRDLVELGISSYYAAAAHFIFGNISNARRLAARSRESSLEAVLPGWADRSRFLEGRLCFETGFYQEALGIFKELRGNLVGPGTQSFEETVDAWIYRAGVYLHRKAVPYTGNAEGPDAQIFQIEAAFICGNYQKVLELANNQDQTEMEERFLLIEQPDWRSGFYQSELFLFPFKDLCGRMIHTFRVLALCHMSKEKGAEKTIDRDEAIREMQRIMRDELPETDPNDTFYLYSYYWILKHTGAPEVDLNTAISIAFKRLQRRASRIDNNDTKRAFLSAHYWNSALTAAAKEHKLI
ncbi:MAG: hypothetical protein FWG27_08840 [Treponema sp.]|nr:hypothetical protein [Treponema sp.]